MLDCIKNKKKVLFLILKTWANDSGGIFDFSNKSVSTFIAYLLNSNYVVRTKYNTYQNIQQHADIDTENGDDLLFYANNAKEDTFILVNPLPLNLKPNEDNFTYINNKIWYILNSEGIENMPNGNEDYYLNENDIIKLGKIKYIVQKIHILQNDNINNNEAAPPKPAFEIYNISNTNKNTKSIFNLIYQVQLYKNYHDINEKIQDDKIQDDKNKDEKEIICDYCKNKNIMSEEDDGDNFLISICKCNNLYYHYKCLKNYFRQLMEIGEPDKKSFVKSYIFKNFECSYCKTPYPTKFKLAKMNKTFFLVDIFLPEDSNYLYLESIDYKVNDINYKSFHIVKLTKENKIIRIGRQDDNDIVDRDISMSRYHAILNFDEETGKICIKNISQKFGTLVLVKNPINVLNKKIFLQVGRTYIEASLLDREEYEKKMKEKEESKVNDEKKDKPDK
jgi:hypothetical protein